MAREMKDSGSEWIGEIPKEWTCHFFKNIITQNDGGIWGDDSVDDNGETVLRSTEQTVDGKWDIVSPAKRDLSKISNKIYYLCKKNDLLITKSSGSNLHIGKTTIVDDVIEKEQCYYSNFIQRIRLSKTVSAKYYWYILNSDISRSQFTYMQNTTSGIGNINSMHIANLIVPKPTLQEQYRIVKYLDIICLELDNVLEKTRASIDEYKKLKQAVITQAVTRGVRDNREMKDSQSTWFGQIPSDWEMRKIKYIFKIQKDIAGEEGYTVLSITQKGIKPKDLSKNEGQLAENYSNYQLVHIGDFAMNHMDLLTGWVDVSKYEGVTSPDYRVFGLIDKDSYCGQYYLYLMQMCYTNRIFYGLGQGVSGLGRWRLQADKFLNFSIAVPGYEEQKEIASYLDRKCSAIDELIAKKEQYLSEIENYKKSLIYVYVTGKSIYISPK